jgi:hypothetical protein
MLGADLDRIEDAVPRAGVLGYARSAFEAIAKGIPTVRFARDPREYRLVVLGTPVWTGSMASPLRAYLLMNRSRFADVACFCTQAARGAANTLREMQLLAGAEKAPAFATTQAEVESRSYEQALAKFAASLKTSASSSVSAAA